MSAYSPELSTRPEVIALTKCEGLDEDIVAMQRDALAAVAPDAQLFTISSTAHTGLKDVLRTADDRRSCPCRAKVTADVVTDESGAPVITLGDEQLSDHWEVTFDEDEQWYYVSGEKSKVCAPHKL